ncbi:MAG: Cys-tRNA(Pro) deacylase [Candidatus Kapabacteria bacterium]|nr:Cys-tRNA(Pro) deacylase [Ignavibacteriota bacterium]MCW5885670.1 Cys-tRNA(Pro) deacylase [Candidatus Kapabacteria bacterium]
MSKEKFPVTPAIRFLRDNKAAYDEYLYEYKEHGGTAQSAEELGVDEHNVVKTLIFKSDRDIICVLQHGDLEVSVKELARQIGSKLIEQCDEKTAFNHTGYKFGGTSPFGLRKKTNIYAESTILNLDKIYINGGKQGFLIGINPDLLIKLLNVYPVDVAIIK